MTQNVYVVVGLGFGDEGKGTTVDYLAQYVRATAICRFSGGAQAAHNILLSDGTHHCFAQIGAASLSKQIQTFLSRYMVVDPVALINELGILQGKLQYDSLRNITIDSKCLVTTPFHKIINRMRECIRGDERLGSCGMGVGETFSDGVIFGEQVLRIGDLADKQISLKKLCFLRDFKIDFAEQVMAQYSNNEQVQILFAQLTQRGYVEDICEQFYHFATNDIVQIMSANDFFNHCVGPLVFEGSQGVLLDEGYGFYPHITHSQTTSYNADLLLEECDADVVRVGVMRAYMTRHGAGPFVTESYELGQLIPDMHNGTGKWQGNFRVGWLDLVATKYAIACTGNLDYISLTNLDRLSGMDVIDVCTSYEYQGEVGEFFNQLFEYHYIGERVVIDDIKKNENVSREMSRYRTHVLNQCIPIMTQHIGWYEKISHIRSYDELPPSAQQYVQFIEHELNTLIGIVSVGPCATDKICRMYQKALK
ncbi:MAG: adenylosuccinate synthetase [Candidatus Moraniibacteriota bacterium]|jgi:adenylosuccinate synthase